MNKFNKIIFSSSRIAMNDHQLKLFSLVKFSKFVLAQKLLKLKFKIARHYADHKLMRKAFEVLYQRAEKSAKIRTLFKFLKKYHCTLRECQQVSSLKPSTVQLIYAINFSRSKTLRKFFNRMKNAIFIP